MFNKSTDINIKKGALAGGLGLFVLVTIGFFGIQNRVTDVGYRPEQPVPFSHKQHAGQLGMHCQYCHAGVEKSAHSPVPTTSVCMGCHQVIKAESPKLQKVRDSWEKGTPIEWERIHHLPDYAHFNHSRHIRAQIDCQSCHGKIEEQGVVAQNKPLSMGWCLDCHRNPEANVVPARPISGIFTGVLHDQSNMMGSDGKADTNKIKGVLYSSFNPDLIKGVKDRVSPLTVPQYGAWETTPVKSSLEGVPHPKLPGFGPENCSSCHH